MAVLRIAGPVLRHTLHEWSRWAAGIPGLHASPSVDAAPSPGDSGVSTDLRRPDE